MRTVLAVLLASACGRVGFDATAPDTDAGADAVDAPLGLFGAPTPIVELNSTSEDDDPTLTGDELEMIFSSSRSGEANLWRTKRSTPTDTWDPPEPVAELNTAVAEKTPELSQDGLTLFFARGDGSNADIYVSSRADRTATWSSPMRIAELSSGSDDAAPAPSPDLLSLVLTRGTVTVDSRLLLSTRPTTSSPWGTPVPILDDPNQQENQAWLDETAICYTVNTNTPPLQSIVCAERLTQTTFGPKMPIPEIDLPGDDADPWLASSRRTIYFEHIDDLYVAHR